MTDLEGGVGMSASLTKVVVRGYNDDRPTVDAVLMDCAFAWKKRSTCPTRHVGCVIARDGRILSSGYNGAPAGMPHCDHPAASDDPNRPTCTTTVHDVANAIAYAARHGVALAGATAVCTDAPCRECAKLIIQAGIERVVYADEYRDETPLVLLADAGVQVDRMHL